MGKNFQAIAIVLFTTLFTSTAQIFLKLGTQKQSFGFLGLIFNHFIIIGLILYAVGGVLAFHAFRKGQVTVVYPVFASSYIWVSLSSIYFFGERMNIFKIIGVLAVFIGISVISLSSGSKRKFSGK